MSRRYCFLLAGLKLYFFGVVFSMKSVSEQSHHEEEPHEGDLVRDFELLNEEDIPDASLNGKTPRELRKCSSVETLVKLLWSSSQWKEA